MINHLLEYFYDDLFDRDGIIYFHYYKVSSNFFYPLMSFDSTIVNDFYGFLNYF